MPPKNHHSIRKTSGGRPEYVEWWRTLSGTESFQVVGAAATHVGWIREVNEDACLVGVDENFVILADGMGGHDAGDVASSMTVDTIAKTLRAARDKPGPANLIQAIQSANGRVWQQAQKDPNLRGMGTTVVCLWLVGDVAIYAHVGDSRLYRLRDGKLKRLTLDHSPIGDEIRNGRRPEIDLDILPSSHLVTRSIGLSGSTTPEIGRCDVQVGDRFLLCTDGLTDEVLHPVMTDALVKSPNSASAVMELLEAALACGGQDNVTISVVEICKEAHGEPSTAATLRLPATF